MRLREDLYLGQLDAIRLRTHARRLLLQRSRAARDEGERLLEQLDAATVVPSSTVARDLVTMNSALMCEDTATGKMTRVTLVYPEQADATAGRISVLSPMGWSLLGLHAGEEAQFETAGDAGPRRIRVLQVSFQPEAAGQWML